MKTYSLLFLFLFSFLSLFSQSDGISYQAIIIDNNDAEIPGIDVSGNYLAEGNVELKFSIYDQNGAVEYQEIQSTKTDKYGMVSLIIGQGETTQNSQGYFDEISWDGSPKLLVVALAYEGENFVDLSSQELLFVPYAYHRNITATGTLIVDQETTLNSSLSVLNQSITYLSGELTTDGDALFNGHSIFNTIYVENESVLNGSLSVNGIADFNAQLNVFNASPTYLSGELAVDGISNFNAQLNVLNASATYLSGDLTIDGISNLNNALNVNNQSLVFFSGDFNLAGIAQLNNNLYVNNGSASYFSGDIFVEGNSSFQSADFTNINVSNEAIINGNFSVTNQSSSSLSGDLYVNGISTLNSSLTVQEETQLNGQVTINATVSGGQNSYAAYPLRVQGSNQGIAIKLNGSRNKNKNFLTFFDGSQIARGRIEGQTLAELHNSYRFIWDIVMQGLETAFIAAEGVACGFQLDWGESGVMAANYITLGAKWVELSAYQEINAGVSFSSGGADYAEWIEKDNPKDIISPGEVVGIKGGKISRNTRSADHILVISTNPIVTGNLPEENKESHFEKVGFLGQLPIRTVGIVKEGDYIIASGNNDGLALAISPDNLPTRLFDQIIGISWESSSNEGLKLINVAIGLNTNDLAKRLSSLESSVSRLEIELNELKALLLGDKENLDEVSSIQVQKTETETLKFGSYLRKQDTEMAEEEFTKWLRDYAYIFEENMLYIKKKFNENNIDYHQYAEIANIIDEPIETLRKMKSGEYMQTLWNSLEARHLNN
jgi:hypothetical protein